MAEWFNLWMAAHATNGVSHYLVFALGGLMGAAGYSAAAMPSWTLPKRDATGALEPGILGVLISGMVLALIVGYALPFSLVAGVIGAPGLTLVHRAVLRLAEVRITHSQPISREHPKKEEV